MNHQFIKGCLVAFLIVIGLMATGCREKGARLQSSATPPDKELFKNGNEWLKKSQYLKSRLAFQTLINTYPDSDLAAESFFAIADSYYEESGKEALLQAEAQYKDFMVFYPTHEKRAEAQLKVASLNGKMMEDPDRDPTYAHRAEIEYNAFLEKFATHPLVPEVREELKKVQDVLAAGEYGKGQFYYKQRKYKPALARYETVHKKYPKYGEMDTVLFEMAMALRKLDREPEAIERLRQLAGGYEGPKAEAAIKMLTELNKPVPPKDETLVALHNGYREAKPPLLKSPIAYLGDMKRAFAGQEDPYKKMIARNEERISAKAAGSAVAVAKGPGETDKPTIVGTVILGPGGTQSSATVTPPAPRTNPPTPSNSDKESSSSTVAAPAGPEPAKETLKPNPAGANPNKAEKEDTKDAKKKRGLLKRIFRAS